MVTSAAAAKKAAVPAGEPAKAAAAAAQPAAASATDESTLVTGAAYQEAVQRITEMGFSKESAVKALRASFNNPDRAVEYLTLGFPEGVGASGADEEAGAAMEAGGESDEDEADHEHDEHEHDHEQGEGEAGGSALEFLRQDPQFQQLRAVIQQNPQLLGPIIEQLGQSSPEIFQLIQQHEDEFIALMNEGPDGEPLLGLDELAGQPGSRVIELTEDESAAVERLQALGFDKARAVEAYFACDKNEELAANFLFEGFGDDE